ncbi:MAG: 4-alpha-glucanotransferase [Clostridia bacterium]|nr:4-alpha-glucanotransferase [Clostridia bacterium]
MKRSSGVLMHISSLFGDYSTGSFGKNAKYFIDFLAECRFSYWQVLPFCMIDECNSPYKSYSAFGGNPYFIDLEVLHEKELVTQSELEEYKQKTPYVCEYERLAQTRLKLLFAASKRAKNKDEIEKFIENNEYLNQVCTFMSLKAANGDKKWTQWTVNKVDSDILFMWKFIQFEFFAQWKEITDYAHSKGIKIIGDIPIYVSFDSCDVWGNKENFLLDSENKCSAVAGVPPDYFCEDGQLWGNPLYNWKRMEKNGFKWWEDRMKHMFTLFDAVRIDHFRGIESYWSIPGNAKTAREGKWMPGPGKAFVDKMNEIKGDKLIIAEDLGDITREVEELVEYSGFPGMRVLQFGFLGNDDTPHLPHNYPNNCIAYTGTHDNNTLLGYVWELNDAQRKYLLEYCGYKDENWDKCYDSIIRTMFAGNAGVVIMPIQDLLCYGSDTRLNVPGRAEGNWQYRITKEQLDSIDRKKYARLNSLYKRG